MKKTYRYSALVGHTHLPDRTLTGTVEARDRSTARKDALWLVTFIAGAEPLEIRITEGGAP